MDLDRDRALVTRAQSGDESAFDELFVLYRKRLRQACLSRLGDPDEAEDIAQEAFARAWRALPGFNGERKFYSWLAVIAANLCTDVLRRRSVSNRVSAAVGDLELASPDESGEDLIVVAAERELAKRALRCLPQRQIRLIQLREQSGWSYDKIADHEGLSSNSIETLMSRARQALKREFARLSEADRFSVSALAGILSFRLRRLFGSFKAAGRVGAPSAPHIGYAVAGTAIILAVSPLGPLHGLIPGSGPAPSQQATRLVGGLPAGAGAFLNYGTSSQATGANGVSPSVSLAAEVDSPGGWLASLTGGQSSSLISPLMRAIDDIGGTMKGVESTFSRLADGLDGAGTTVGLALGDLIEVGNSSAPSKPSCCTGTDSPGSQPSDATAADSQGASETAAQSPTQTSSQSPSSSSSEQQPVGGATGEQSPSDYYSYYDDQPNDLAPDSSQAQPSSGTSANGGGSQQDGWTSTAGQPTSS